MTELLVLIERCQTTQHIDVSGAKSGTYLILDGWWCYGLSNNIWIVPFWVLWVTYIFIFLIQKGPILIWSLLLYHDRLLRYGKCLRDTAILFKTNEIKDIKILFKGGLHDVVRKREPLASFDRKDFPATPKMTLAAAQF